MNASEYKRFHESFMSNNHGSDGIHTFFCIFFTVQCSLYVSIGRKNSGFTQYLYEYLVIILPLVLVHTVLAKYVYMLNVTAFVLLLYRLVNHSPKLRIMDGLKQPNLFNYEKIKLISCLRGLTYLITVLCILAVDFQSFPRYLAKTERFGYSLMDTGVGLFVLMSGFVHKDLRNHRLIDILNTNLKFVTILILLGVARFIAVKKLDYQEHVTEYGVHWNFFFTLAVCKVVSTILLYYSDRALVFSVAILILHEFLLCVGLQQWIFSAAPRTNFLNANREGLSSCLGYVSLYLFSAHIKKELVNKSIQRYILLKKLLVGSLLLTIMAYFSHIFRPVSRTLTNLSYCMYLEAVFLTITSLMYFIEVLFQYKDKEMYFSNPLIVEAINRNGLVYFLIANLLTGFINLSLRTLFLSTVKTFVILNLYMIVTTALCIYLIRRGFAI